MLVVAVVAVVAVVDVVVVVGGVGIGKLVVFLSEALTMAPNAIAPTPKAAAVATGMPANVSAGAGVGASSVAAEAPDTRKLPHINTTRALQYLPLVVFMCALEFE